MVVVHKLPFFFHKQKLWYVLLSLYFLLCFYMNSTKNKTFKFYILSRHTKSMLEKAVFIYFIVT